MTLKSVKLRNFKPFYGDNTVVFSDESGVTLFGAKNDRGKTAFLEAIQFCLYDFTSDNDGSRTEKRDRCINHKAVSESDGETIVSTSFEHNNNLYSIDRTLEFSKTENQAAREAKEHYVTVQIDEEESFYIDTRKEDDITDYREFRDGILPKNASHFFIFDGERIDEYARRFGKRDSDVREAIELVLGIEELRKAVSDLQKHGVDHYRGLFQEAQSDTKDFEEKKNKLEEERQTLKQYKEKITEKEESLDSYRKKKNEVEEDLAMSNEVQEKYERLLKTRVELYGPDHKDVGKAKDYLDEDEIDELTPSVQKRLKNVREERQEIYQRFGPIAGAIAAQEIDSVVALNTPGGLAEVLRRTLEERPEDCYVCDQNMDEVSRTEMVDRLKETIDESTEEARYIDQLAEGLREATEGDQYDSGHQKAQLKYLTEQISGLEQDISKRERRIERLDEIIQNARFGVDEVDEIRDRLDELKRQEARVELEIENLEENIDDQADLVKEIEDDLDGVEGASEKEERYDKLVTVSEQSRDAFKNTKDKYVEQRRQSIEEKASQMFMSMTNKKDVYEGLSIDSDYQLRVRTNEGTFTIADQDPSRGARQIIAYSFIAGLAQFSSRDAPILIDTPIARLDPSHKANLLQNLPRFVDQVIVLYQPNELTEDDIQMLDESGDIVDHHDIVQGDDPAISTIVNHNFAHF